MSDIDIAKLRRLHKRAGTSVVAALGDKYKLRNGAEVRDVLTEPGGASMLEICLPEHAAYAVEAWNVAPRLADRVELLERLLAEALDLAEEGWSYASDYFNEKWAPKERHERIRKEAQLP